MKIRLLIIAFLCCLVASCGGYKKMLRDAKAFEEAGMKKEAYARYEQLDRAYQRPDGKLGMRRIAQQEVDALFQKAQMLCMSGNYEAAFAAFNDAVDAYKSKPQLELRLPADAEIQQQNCKQNYITGLYNEAEKQALAGQFDQAKATIDRLLRYDPNNEKAGYLQTLCDILPNYQAGLKAMDLGLFEEAYKYFNEVIKLDAGYKDALQLRDQALKKAQYTIAFIPIAMQGGDDLQLKISAAVKQAILGLNNPMIRLVDRDDLTALIQEQSKNMTPFFDEKTALEAGKLLGARYLITGKLVGYIFDGPRIKQTEKKGFLGPTLSSGKIKYTEFSETSSLTASLKYQIVDGETGEIYASGMVPYHESDTALRAWFGGETSKVYPGNWNYLIVSSKQDKVDVSGYEALQKKFKEEKSAKTEMQFQEEMSRRLADAIAEDLKKFNPRR